LILDSTIFHPQGGGQPADTGVITIAADSSFKFIVQDVRSKDGIVSFSLFEVFELLGLCVFLDFIGKKHFLGILICRSTIMGLLRRVLVRILKWKL